MEETPRPLNWPSIASFLFFGFLMGFAYVSGFSKGIEWLLWLLITIACVAQMARQSRSKPFLNGFLAGIAVGLPVPIILWSMFTVYATNNPDYVVSLDQFPAVISGRKFFIISAVPILLFYGISVGLLTHVIRRYLSKSNP
jgi:hypothetical protein